MKTSSKIFTGIFLTPIIIPLIVAGTIIYKVKSGQVEKNGLNPLTYDAQYFPQAKHIVARGLENLEITFSDSLEVDIYHTDDVMVKTQMNGDTLFLRGDTSYVIKQQGPNNVILFDTSEARSSRKVVLKIPSGFPVTVQRSIMDLTVDADRSPVINLNLINSTLNRSAYDASDMYTIAQFNLSAKNSTINIDDWDIRSLQLNLQTESRADLGSSKLGLLDLKIDSTSRIELYGDQIKKLSPIK